MASRKRRIDLEYRTRLRRQGYLKRECRVFLRGCGGHLGNGQHAAVRPEGSGHAWIGCGQAGDDDQPLTACACCGEFENNIPSIRCAGPRLEEYTPTLVYCAVS